MTEKETAISIIRIAPIIIPILDTSCFHAKDPNQSSFPVFQLEFCTCTSLSHSIFPMHLFGENGKCRICGGLHTHYISIFVEDLSQLLYKLVYYPNVSFKLRANAFTSVSCCVLPVFSSKLLPLLCVHAHDLSRLYINTMIF